MSIEIERGPFFGGKKNPDGSIDLSGAVVEAKSSTNKFEALDKSFDRDVALIRNLMPIYAQLISVENINDFINSFELKPLEKFYDKKEEIEDLMNSFPGYDPRNPKSAFREGVTSDDLFLDIKDEEDYHKLSILSDKMLSFVNEYKIFLEKNK